ncbi:MAG: hypothetical protein ACKOPN_06330 [Prochlorococcaceae cyanobacterium]
MDPSTVPDPAQRWEYRVIHLHVEPPTPDPGARPDPGTQVAGAAEPPQPFSRHYLEQEFPAHYTTEAAQPGGARPQHPAQQLQAFLNHQGEQGWGFEGIHAVGALLMMVFRRPLPVAAVAAPEPSAAATGTAPALAEILRRLEALEAERRPPAPSRGDPLSDGMVIDAQALGRYSDEPRLSTGAAAAALGFRSPASLANHGSRHGFPPGLIKRGANGRIAIYVGDPDGTGAGGAARRRRHWIILDQAALGPGGHG